MTDLFGGLPQIDKDFLRRGYVAPITDTGWQPPSSFPYHYQYAARLAYDIETRETDFEHGAGWARGLGYIVGVSVAAQFHDGNIESVYFPMRHDMETHLNMDSTQVFAFLKWLLEMPMPKVGANLLYDYGWMLENGIKPNGLHLDVQFAEALMSNNGEVNLEFLGQKYCGVGKTTDALYNWIRATFPKTPPSKTRRHIWQSPPQLVGFYAEQDAELPLRVFEKQWQVMVENQLTDVFLMECKLIPLLVEMRMKGITVDLDKTVALSDKLKSEIIIEQNRLGEEYGMHFNYNSPQEIGVLCDSLKIKYPRTESGAASFTKDWMKSQTHPLFASINELREKDKTVGTFLEGYFIGGAIKSKIHCSFHPLRSDDGGTRTGRFSSSNPNLQNIPARTQLGAEIRSLVIPDYGHECMWVGDYSQIEYRTLAHFAVGNGSNEVRQRYIDDPTTDYHDMTIALVKSLVGLDIPRKYIKNINFGLLYGMSVPTLAAQLGLTVNDSKPIFTAYHSAAPYVKATMAQAAEEAAELGYVRTISGRKGYFDLYSPIDGYGVSPLPYDEALRRWGNMIERDKLYKAINYKIQGSAADGMKMAMLKGYESGVFDVIGVPRLTVHDELVFSVPERTKAVVEGFAEFKHQAETCLPFSVPLLFDADFGFNWGEAKG